MDSDDDNSNMFKVDHSDAYPVNKYSHAVKKQQQNKERIGNFFNKDTEILKQGQKRKVVYGTMEQQSRTAYQILQPYFATIAKTTGSAATTAGKGLYEALTIGAGWLYDKIVNSFIPYTQEQLPKLIFVIKGKPNKNQCKHYSSQNFHVLQLDEDQYAGIAMNKKNKNGKKRIIVPLDPNDKQFAKFLEDQHYVPDYSFPIDIEDDDEEEESYLIPSANFMVLHQKAKQNNEEIEKHISQENNVIENIDKQKMEENNEQNGIKSIIQEGEEYTTKIGVQSYKKAQISKKVFKMKDFYMFELEGKNSIQYDLLDNIERDEHTQSGYFMIPERVLSHAQSNDGSNGPNSGEVPMVVDKQLEKSQKQNKKKVVDAVPRVRVQIPQQSTQNAKIEEREIQYA